VPEPAAGDGTYALIRRILLFVEHSLDRGLRWIGFEPTDDPGKRRLRRR
jgi:hypothetical protein